MWSNLWQKISFKKKLDESATFSKVNETKVLDETLVLDETIKNIDIEVSNKKNEISNMILQSLINDF